LSLSNSSILDAREHNEETRQKYEQNEITLRNQLKNMTEKHDEIKTKHEKQSSKMKKVYVAIKNTA